MSDALGPITFRKKEGEVFLGRDMMSHQREYSEKTAELIDSEVKRIITECAVRAQTLLKSNFDKLNLLAEKLMEKEILNLEEVDELLGLTPQKPPEPRKEAPSSATETAERREPGIGPGTAGSPLPQPV
jgi:cell division protease FtsH